MSVAQSQPNIDTICNMFIIPSVHLENISQAHDLQYKITRCTTVSNKLFISLPLNTTTFYFVAKRYRARKSQLIPRPTARDCEATVSRRGLHCFVPQACQVWQPRVDSACGVVLGRVSQASGCVKRFFYYSAQTLVCARHLQNRHVLFTSETTNIYFHKAEIKTNFLKAWAPLLYFTECKVWQSCEDSAWRSLTSREPSISLHKRFLLMHKILFGAGHLRKQQHFRWQQNNWYPVPQRSDQHKLVQDVGSVTLYYGVQSVAVFGELCLKWSWVGRAKP